MTIIMVVEYFYPFDRGGSEWSTFYLAQGLQKKGHRVVILTPNYGARKKEIWENIEIRRFPFLVKLHKHRQATVTPLWFTNGLWYLVTTWSLFWLSKRIKADIIHLQGKYYLPAGWIVKLLTRIPVVATIRDYQILCPYGVCLSKNKGYKKCSMFEFIFREYISYLRIYHKKANVFYQFILLLSGVRAKLVALILQFFARRVEVLILISKKQREIYTKNGIKHAKVIYNMMNFPKRRRDKRMRKTVLYVGRLTPGKGVLLLIQSFFLIAKKFPKLKLQLVGEGFLKTTIENMITEKKWRERIELVGQRPYQETLNRIGKAKLVVVPSLWEEPFGRVALESLAKGVPLVVTDRGGLPEIVNHRKTGIVTKPTVKAFSLGIIKAIKTNRRLSKNILKLRSHLKYKFNDQPLNQHLLLYNAIINQ